MSRSTFEAKFHGRPVDEKLVIIFMVITMCSLLIAGLGFRLHQVRVHKYDLVDDLYTQASFLSLNSAAAIRFDVPADAEELLNFLGNQPQLHDVIIYDGNQQLFAAYPHRDSVTDPYLAAGSTAFCLTRTRCD